MTTHSLDGHSPKIHPEAFVHPDATVIGQAVVGARSSIWPGTVLRADMGRIVVGEDTSIQDGTIVHLTEGWSETLVGDRVTVGHRVILHGCLIGMGSILLDNVKVGAGSLVAAGSLVPVGMEIPPGSFVRGSPAVVSGPVKDHHKAMIDGGWRTYVEYSKRYRDQLKR